MLAPAVLAFLLAGPALGADSLRTLFHSAEERERLDRLRRGESVEARAAAAAPRPPAAVTGFVKRSDGRSTVWLDGRPVTLTGPAANPYTDPAKVPGPRRDSAIEFKRSPPSR